MYFLNLGIADVFTVALDSGRGMFVNTSWFPEHLPNSAPLSYAGSWSQTWFTMDVSATWTNTKFLLKEATVKSLLFKPGGLVGGEGYNFLENEDKTKG